MDRFQSELLAQLKEHNRLTKELVKLERANFELNKEINTVNSNLIGIITPQNPYTDTLGTYCEVNADDNVDDFANYIIQSLTHDAQLHDVFFTRVSNVPTFTGNQLKDTIRVSMKEYVKAHGIKKEGGEENA